MEFSELAQKNPWWKNQDTILQDRNIKQLQTSKIHWIPNLKQNFKLNQDIIYTLRGPRQVGKTTLIKTIIKELLTTCIPEQVFFYTCDLVNSPKELAEILECYLKGARNILPNQRLFLFIDEISSVNEWQRGIKTLVDEGLLENCTMILTGSHSLDIRNASERLPGRRGNVDEVIDKVFLPMKFSEYIESQNPKLKTVIYDTLNVLKTKNQSNPTNILTDDLLSIQLERLNYYSEELKNLFSTYLLTGGIATAVDAYLTQRRIPVNVYETHLRAILGDVAHFQKRSNFVAQIVQKLSESLSTPTSWQAICKQTDLGSHNTVADYVEFLESSFVVSTIYHLDREKDMPIPKKQKKIYFNDPFIFHVLKSWAFSQGSPFESARAYVENGESCSRLVESVVCDHLRRLASSLFPSFDYYASRVYYWKSSSGREVDFVVKMGDKYLPIEVKYQNEVKRSDLYGLHTFVSGGKSHRGIVGTKNTLCADKDIIQIPCYLLLALV